MSRIAVRDWARSLGPPGLRAKIRSLASDFQVDEIPLVEPEGTGTHLWLWVRKTGANTDWVAGQLARCAGVAARDVGYAGLKDRHAVTSQWFSLPLELAKSDQWQQWNIEGVELLDAHPHPRKLKRGALKGNRFVLRLRELRGDTDEFVQRVNTLRETGIPNYFGAQRFGHDGANLQRAERWIGKPVRLKRNRRSLLISSLRSFLFNEVLSRRVEDGNWDRLLDGDICMLAGSRSLFSCQLPDEDLVRRCLEGDLGPAGPLPGRGGTSSERQALSIESAVLSDFRECLAGLEQVGASRDWRPLRAWPEELELELDVGDSEAELRFALPAGSYATALLRELVTGQYEPISKAV